MENDNANNGKNEDKWCFAWPPAADLTGKTKATLLKDFKWQSGDRITVSFLDGDPSVQQRVKQVARQWVAPGLANLSLDFPEGTTDTLIRISFNSPGSWSALGTSCRNITDRAKPTMNYGWLRPDSSDDSLRRVVLHEFGHALGLDHEHKNPGGGINWNRENVIRDLSGPPNNWSLADIEFNMFEPIKKEQSNFTKLDLESIMIYPIPATWTLDGTSVDLNTNLSNVDKQFIRQQYP